MCYFRVNKETRASRMAISHGARTCSFFAFLQDFNDNKIPCRSPSDLQPLRKALYTARAHTIILLKISRIMSICIIRGSRCTISSQLLKEL